MVKFCSNLLRTSSNISYLAFTLHRFAMIAILKGSFWVKFQKLNTKLFILITLTVSALINVHTIFQFYINSDPDYYKIIEIDISVFTNNEPFDDYKTTSHLNQNITL